MIQRLQQLAAILAGLALILILWIAQAPAEAPIDDRPVDRPVPTPEPGLQLLLVDVPAHDSRLWLVRPVDPTILEDLPGYAPVLVDGPFAHAFSTDGGKLAMLVPGTNEKSGSLYLLDLNSWSVEVVPSVVNGYAPETLAVSAEGLVFWLDPEDADTDIAAFRRNTLHRYDPHRRRATVVTALPALFEPTQARLLRSERAMAIFGLLKDAGEPKPHIIVVDLNSGTIVTDLTIQPGDRSREQQPEKATLAGLDAPLPLSVWDIGRDLLYVIHPRNNHISVVDLATGSVVREAYSAAFWDPIQPAISSYHQAALSADGDRLYIMSYRYQREDTAGPPHHQELPIALRVIRTSDLRERLRIQRPAIDIALSPDGQYLLAGTAQFGERERSNPGGLFVFETTQFKQVARLESGRFVVVHGFSPDGRYASISSSNGEDAPRTVIKVLDLQRLEVIAEKEFVSRHVEFIAIPRRL